MPKPRAPHAWVEIATFVAALVLWSLIERRAPVALPAASPIGATEAPARAVAPGAAAERAAVTFAPKRSFAHWTRRPESDVVAEPYGLTIEALRALRPGERLELPDPDGGTIDFDVVARDRTGAFDRIRLSHDDLPSTVTLSATTFHATIATARGAYAVSNDGGETLLVRNTALDRRMIPDAPDFAVSPRT